MSSSSTTGATSAVLAPALARDPQLVLRSRAVTSLFACAVRADFVDLVDGLRLNESPRLTTPFDVMRKLRTTTESSASNTRSCSNFAATLSSKWLTLLVRERGCSGELPEESRAPAAAYIPLRGRRWFFQELERLCGADWLTAPPRGLGALRVGSVT